MRPHTLTEHPPLYTSPLLPDIWFRDILEKNNLPIPTNYEELCSVADKAAELARNNNLWIRGENSEGYSATEWRKASTAEAYTAFPISYGDMWVHEFVDYTAAVQNGGSIVDEKGMPAWNSNETANGLQVLRDWIFPSEQSTNKTALSKDYGSSYDVGDAPFNSGKCIFKFLIILMLSLVVLLLSCFTAY